MTTIIFEEELSPLGRKALTISEVQRLIVDGVRLTDYSTAKYDGSPMDKREIVNLFNSKAAIHRLHKIDLMLLGKSMGIYSFSDKVNDMREKLKALFVEVKEQVEFKERKPLKPRINNYDSNGFPIVRNQALYQKDFYANRREKMIERSLQRYYRIKEEAAMRNIMY